MAATTNKPKVPALRFPGFSDDWQFKKLGNFAHFSKGKGISKSELDPEGSRECILYGELYTTYGEVIYTVYSRTVDTAGLVLSKANDVIIPASGETAIDIATAACVLHKGVALGGDLNIIRSKENGVFLSYYLNGRRRFEIARLSQGSSVIHLYSNYLKLLELYLPNLQEQQKIADFLTAVDTKIQQLKRKHGLMQQYKKGVMQQLFSQQVRFKDDDGRDYPDWEEDEFGSLVHNKPRKYDPGKMQEDFPCVELDSLSQETGQLLQIYSSKEQASIKNQFQKGNVLFGKLRPYLKKFWLARFDGVCSTEIWVFAGKKVSNEFLLYLIQTQEFQQIANVSSGSKMPRSDWEFISNYPIAYPCLEEQRKIAGFLAAIDSKIQQIGAQIEKAETFKQGLLQQMFV